MRNGPRTFRDAINPHRRPLPGPLPKNPRYSIGNHAGPSFSGLPRPSIFGTYGAFRISWAGTSPAACRKAEQHRVLMYDLDDDARSSARSAQRAKIGVDFVAVSFGVNRVPDAPEAVWLAPSVPHTEGRRSGWLVYPPQV